MVGKKQAEGKWRRNAARRGKRKEGEMKGKNIGGKK